MKHLHASKMEANAVSIKSRPGHWDEWEPGSNNDPIPEYPEADGPYYSPTDPEKRTPTIDTIPNGDHTCDGTLDGVRPNWQCLRSLTVREKAIIYDSVDVYVRPLGQIADSLQRMECDSLYRWMDEFRDFSVLSETGGVYIDMPLIYAGRSDAVLPGKHQHDAQSNNKAAGYGVLPQIVHFDPKALDSVLIGTATGKKGVLRAMMHESAHAWRGIDHDSLLAAADSGYPNDPFFRTLHRANACIIP